MKKSKIVISILSVCFFICSIMAFSDVIEAKKKGPAKPLKGVININKATVKQLTMLPGIGKTKANGIIAQRPYKTVDELIKVKDILNKILLEVEVTLSKKELSSSPSIMEKYKDLRLLADKLNQNQIERTRNGSSKTRLSILYYAFEPLGLKGPGVTWMRLETR